MEKKIEYKKAWKNIARIAKFSLITPTQKDYNDMILIEEFIDKFTPPKDFEEAMEFHRIAMQEHLGSIARLQERCSEDEYGSKNYKFKKELVEEYLNDECECAIKEVIERIRYYIDDDDE